MAAPDWMVDARERRARVIAGITAIVTSVWLFVLAFRAPATAKEGAGPLFYLVAIFGLAASVSAALMRRALVARSPERWSKSWKDLLNPWTYSLGLQLFWLAAAPPVHSRFFAVHMSIVGATVLLLLAGRSADRRPYR